MCRRRLPFSWEAPAPSAKFRLRPAKGYRRYTPHMLAEIFGPELLIVLAVILTFIVELTVSFMLRR